MPWQEPPATETPQWEDPFPPADDLSIPQASVFDVLEPDNQSTKLPPIVIRQGGTGPTFDFSPYAQPVQPYDTRNISLSLFPDDLTPAQDNPPPTAMDEEYSDFDWYQDVGYFDQSQYDQQTGYNDVAVSDAAPDYQTASDYAPGYEPVVDDSSIYDYQATSDQGPLETAVGGNTPDLVDNGDGSFTNEITGLVFDNLGNVIGGTEATDPVAGFDDLGGGWYENPITGNITDADGNVIYALNENGTYLNVGSGTDVDLFGVQAQAVSIALDSFFNPVDKLDASMFGGPSSMPAVVQPGQRGGSFGSGGGGGVSSGSGSTSTKQTPASPGAALNTATKPNPSAAQKTIVADQRLGNDRYLVYSDGSSQRIANYYKPAPGATSQPTTVSSLLDNLFKATGSVIGAVSGTPGNVGAGTLNQAVAKPTSATPITGQYLNTQASNVGGAKPLGTPTKPDTVPAKNNSTFGLLALGALAVKVFILH